MLLIDKPAGPTSHDVVGAVRRVLGQRRVGHAGTLDPGATGLLVVLSGRATRLARFTAERRKRYTGTIRFGWETSTDDAAGAPTLRDDSGRTVSRADLEAALDAVRAQPLQVPPPVSAKKVDGTRAYKLARNGQAVDLEPVPVTLFNLQLSTFNGLKAEAVIEVECSAGTYVRAIARDVGRALGGRAHLAALRRTAVGEWRVEDAVPLEELTRERADARTRPMAEIVAHLPRLAVDAEGGRRFRFGQKWPAAAGATGFAAVFEGEDLLGVAEYRGGLVCPTVGLAS